MSKEKKNKKRKDNITEEDLAKTQIMTKISDQSEEIVLEEKHSSTENKTTKSSSNNNKLLFICIGIISILLLIIIALILMIFINFDKPKNSEKNKELSKDKSLTTDEYKAIIDSYAAATTLAVQNYIQTNNGTIPKFSEIKEQIIFESYNVSCEESIINYNGSIYLAKCKIDNYEKNNDIIYGEKLTEPQKTGNKLYIYKYTLNRQNISTGELLNHTYYNYYKEEQNIQSDNGVLLDIYECYDVNCQAYTTYKDTNDTLLYDNGYYIYNLNNKNRQSVNIPNEAYDQIRFIKKNSNSSIVALHKNSKVALYNLEEAKNVTDFEYATILSHDVLTSKGYAIASKTNDSNSYLVNINAGSVARILKNIISPFEMKVGDKVLYTAYTSEDDGSNYILFDDNFEPLIKDYDNYTYAINSDNTITVVPTKSNKFYIYDLNGNNLYTSKDYNNFQKVVRDHIIILDENNDLKIINTKEEELATLLNVKENHRLHPMISGWYTENGKNGIYFVVENKDISYGTQGSGVEYYYIPTTQETGVIETMGVGGYAKPVLYLYPTKKTEVTVNFANEELLTTTYPKFKNSWQVTAHPNGNLYDKNKNYYYGLYWEEAGSIDVDFAEGFYVEKDDAIEFLETKLEKIGLNSRERNEFIMYWLPILEKNEKNLVYFELTESRENYNKLLISPKPDSLLRVAIHIKKVNEKTNIKEQNLPTFKRKGFTAVEWGGVVH